MNALREELLARSEAAADPIMAKLIPILTQRTGTSTAGYPYFQREAWEAFRDGVPHLLGMGLRTLRSIERLEAIGHEVSKSDEFSESDERENLLRACKVARQIVFTAAITAPCDLWLMRHLLGAFQGLGLLRRLLDGEALYPESCQVEVDRAGGGCGERKLVARELDVDLHFLLARGVVEQYDNGFRLAGHPRVRRLCEAIEPLPTGAAAGVSRQWGRLFGGKSFGGQSLETADLDALLDLGLTAPGRVDPSQNHWIAAIEEVELGYRLVPIVLGLRVVGRTSSLPLDCEVRPSEWSADHPACAAGAMDVLSAAGWLERAGNRYRVTKVGARGFARAPGPFGIIETYHPYMTKAREILLKGRGAAWVSRGENVGASQDANRGTFRKANAALDRFCAETGFRVSVFVEHAIGRGEATRQRFVRDGEASIRYFGADLEDAAIDAAVAEQDAGRLPKNMVFVRRADIGRPEVLVEGLRAEGVDPKGAVMLVGNGFHEVRGQSDAGMARVFRGYCEAGIVLLFTEENALSVDDLRATAWNTYHAGFKYVHEKSGQGLRPANPRPAARLGHPLRAAWSQCALAAGYVRANAYCSRTRTIYPYPPRSGHNPSISVNHFFVPAELAEELGIDRGA